MFLGFELNFLLFFGLFAQFIFLMRFVVQWIHSERRKESIVPISFWYLSVIGAGLLLIYSIYRKDLVFILGQGLAIFIYLRNLQLIYRKK